MSIAPRSAQVCPVVCPVNAAAACAHCIGRPPPTQHTHLAPQDFIEHRAEVGSQHRVGAVHVHHGRDLTAGTQQVAVKHLACAHRGHLNTGCPMCTGVVRVQASLPRAACRLRSECCSSALCFIIWRSVHYQVKQHRTSS